MEINVEIVRLTIVLRGSGGITMKSDYRPILKLQKTKGEWIWDIIGGTAFVLALIYLAFSYAELPNEVPGHYNAKGEVDRWGSKTELFILPLVGLFTWGFLHIIEKFPHVHNYPRRLNENNVEKFYLNSRKLINEVKNIGLLVFAILIYEDIQVTIGDIDSLGTWILPLIFAGFLLPIIIRMIISKQIK